MICYICKLMKPNKLYKTQFYCPDFKVGIHPEYWFLLHDIERYKFFSPEIYDKLSSIMFLIHSKNKSEMANETVPIKNFQFEK